MTPTDLSTDFLKLALPQQINGEYLVHLYGYHRKKALAESDTSEQVTMNYLAAIIFNTNIKVSL